MRRNSLSTVLAGLALALLGAIPWARPAQAPIGAIVFVARAGGTVAEEPPEEPPGGDLFRDLVEYTVGRDDTGGLGVPGSARTAFQNAGWSEVKRDPSNSGNCYIYTDEKPDGYVGANPPGVQNWIHFEAHPELAGADNMDGYLQLGDEGGSFSQFPAKTYWQFYIYHDDSGAELTNSKFGYFTDDDDGTPWPSAAEHGGIIIWRREGFQPTGSWPADGFVFGNRLSAAGGGSWEGYDPGADPVGNKKLWQNVSPRSIPPETIVLVRFEFDLSGAQGRWRHWERHPGDSDLVLQADWQGGVTTDFVWPTTAAERGGLLGVRIPTVMNSVAEKNFWITDFQVSTDPDLLSNGDDFFE